MARRERLVLNGEPGGTFTNDTGRVLYQLIVNWHFSCGLCAQYDHAVGPSWPIPFHRNCRCHQLAIWPGHESRPYVDFMEKIRELDVREQGKVVGRSNLTLIENGVVQWSDVVTRTRIRELREVVSLKKLDVKTMVNVGVDQSIAERAYEAVHTSAHLLAEETRKRLVESILAKGVERDTLRKVVSERLAGRVRISSGPSGPGTLPIEPTDLTPPPPPPPLPKPSPRPKPAPKPTPPAKATPAQVQDAYTKALNLKTPPPKVETFAERMARRVREEIDRLKVEFATAKEASEKAEAAWNAIKNATRVDPQEYDRRKEEARETYGKALGLSEQAKRFKSWQSEVKANPNLIPPFSIEERIKIYSERGADAKVKALAGLAAGKPDPREQLAALDRAREDARARRAATRDLKTREKIEDELAVINAQRRRLAEPTAPPLERLAEAIAPGRTMRIRPDLAGHAALGPDATALTPAMRPAIEEGLEFLGRVVSAAGLAEMTVRFARLVPGSDTRSHCTPEGIVLEESRTAKVVVHEFGHYLEFQTGAGRSALDFLEYRVANEPLQRLSDVLPGSSYDANERGRKDRFDAAFGEQRAWYVGKDYRGQASEITSMGLEQLYRDPAGFAKSDPEYVKFILGVLDGSLR